MSWIRCKRKTPYPTKSVAILSAKRVHRETNEVSTAYQCKFCDKWHLQGSNKHKGKPVKESKEKKKKRKRFPPRFHRPFEVLKGSKEIKMTRAEVFLDLLEEDLDSLKEGSDNETIFPMSRQYFREFIIKTERLSSIETLLTFNDKSHCTISEDTLSLFRGW